MTLQRPFADRFWEKVQKTDTCWLWTAAANHLGYGQIALVPKQRVRATSAAWFLTYGAWPPKGMFLCHRCDVPRCVNPAHLFLGTQRDNMQDAKRKGRMKLPPPSPGITNVNAKLTPERVEELRGAYASGETLSSLSRRFGMARSTLRWAVQGRSWKSVPGWFRPTPEGA